MTRADIMATVGETADATQDATERRREAARLRKAIAAKTLTARSTSPSTLPDRAEEDRKARSRAAFVSGLKQGLDGQNGNTPTCDGKAASAKRTRVLTAFSRGLRADA